jgi:hypothetical protein
MVPRWKITFLSFFRFLHHPPEANIYQAEDGTIAWFLVLLALYGVYGGPEAI